MTKQRRYMVYKKIGKGSMEPYFSFVCKKINELKYDFENYYIEERNLK